MLDFSEIDFNINLRISVSPTNPMKNINFLLKLDEFLD